MVKWRRLQKANRTRDKSGSFEGREIGEVKQAVPSLLGDSPGLV